MLVTYLKKRIHFWRTVKSWFWSLSLSLSLSLTRTHTHTHIHAHMRTDKQSQMHLFYPHEYSVLEIHNKNSHLVYLSNDTSSGCFKARSVFFNTFWTSKGKFFYLFYFKIILANFKILYTRYPGFGGGTENPTKENTFHWYV